MQGGADGWWSASTPIVYTENPDPCGIQNNAAHGTPPSTDYAYYVFYDGVSNTVNCGGYYATYYYYEFKTGSINNPPIAYGYLGVQSGPAQMSTEIYPTHDIPLGVDHYGCDPAMSCSSSSYGMHLYNGTWHTYTSSYAHREQLGNPPWLHVHAAYWNFHTCPSSC